MTTGEILTELEGLIRDERKAIVAFDGETVARLADRKEHLLAELAKSDTQVDLRVDRQRFLSVAAELRHNGILLAHARDCLKEAIDVVKKPLNVRLSVSA